MSITQHFLKECVLFQKKHDVKRWVVALSGGLDSTVVLNLAKEYLFSLPVTAIHINHQIQTQADEWQSLCAQQCDHLDIPFYSFVISPDGKSEQKLRSARYQCFESFLKPGDCLLLGHHANDQAETVLFRLIRGAGLNGLSGMPAHRKIADAWLLRPLLLVNKTQLEQYANERKFLWIEDPSNQSIEYDRNYIRHEVLEPLQNHWHHAVDKMSHSASLLNADQQLLGQYIAQDLVKIDTSNTTEKSIDLAKWNKLGDDKGKAVLRYWMSSIIQRPVTQKELQRSITNVIESKEDSGSAFCPLGDFELRRYKQKLYLLKKIIPPAHWPKIESAAMHKRLSHGCLVIEPSVKGVEIIEGMFLLAGTEGLKIKEAKRPRKKLKQIFQESEIAPWHRKNWPVLMYQDQVVAVLGVCVSEQWLQEDENKSLFCLDWQPI